ncbi:hypothetical protein SRB5_21830 [Streptomyces sp. RB5]|uniref:Integral membrane protein n=1 Tax=Streptomyces smaragdinus TaxID=2585196 RepID=A0A7K0CH32_9ACTN|nr:DUF6114 domain-containing protein [Streptomyces smaragdinus]MQY12054.1 hypothetical protein [Streptomyces smaragdinus]
MSVDSPGQDEYWLRYWRLRFRAWRGSRPFWAGLFTLLGGIPIGYLPYHNLQFGTLSVRIGSPAGASALVIGVLLITLGLTLWFHAIVRVFAGVAAIVLALVSLPATNLGGYFIGFLLAMIGGALAISWAPAAPAEEPAAEGPAAGGPDETYGPGEELPPGATADEPAEPADERPEPPAGPVRSSATISVTKAPGGGKYA